jgi:hypothetical protein
VRHGTDPPATRFDDQNLGQARLTQSAERLAVSRLRRNHIHAGRSMVQRTSDPPSCTLQHTLAGVLLPVPSVEPVETGVPVRLRLVNTDSTTHRYALAGTLFRVAAIDRSDPQGPTSLANRTCSGSPATARRAASGPGGCTSRSISGYTREEAEARNAAMFSIRPTVPVYCLFSAIGGRINPCADLSGRGQPIQGP